MSDYSIKIKLGAYPDDIGSLSSVPAFTGYISSFFISNNVISDDDIYKMFADNISYLSIEDTIAFEFESTSISDSTAIDISGDNILTLSTASLNSFFWVNTLPVIRETYDRLKVYYTSVDFGIEQLNPAQSIGGYRSLNQVYESRRLNADISLYADLIILESEIDTSDYEYAIIGGEVIKILDSGYTSVVNITSRAANGVYEPHSVGESCFFVTKSLFNSRFNDFREQYRCYAIQNDSLLNVESINMYLSGDYQSFVESIRLFAEYPIAQSLDSTSSGFNNSTLTDDSLINAYEDGHFDKCVLEIMDGSNSGYTSIIEDFDSGLGRFVFLDAFPFEQDAPFKYRVYPSPSQRVLNGRVAPTLEEGAVFGLSTIDSPTQLVFADGFNPGDIFYVWVMRRGTERVEERIDDNFFINFGIRKYGES